MGCISRGTSTRPFDSLLYGCIPVLFSNLTDAVAPWFWGGWRASGRVLVSREDFVAGKIDLAAYLGEIPPARVRSMKHSLALNGRRFQYSLEHDPGDAVSVLVRHVAKHATCSN